MHNTAPRAKATDGSEGRSRLSSLLGDRLFQYLKVVKAIRSHAEGSGHAYSPNLFRKSDGKLCGEGGRGLQKIIVCYQTYLTYGAVSSNLSSTIPHHNRDS